MTKVTYRVQVAIDWQPVSAPGIEGNPRYDMTCKVCGQPIPARSECRKSAVGYAHTVCAPQMATREESRSMPRWQYERMKRQTAAGRCPHYTQDQGCPLHGEMCAR